MNNQPRSITEGEIEALLRHDGPLPSPALRSRVAQATWQKEQESMGLFSTLRLWFTPLWRPALALLIVLGLSFLTVSRTTARANFSALAREVGTVLFQETTKYPRENNDAEPIIKTPMRVKVGELAAHLPFSVTLPTAVPAGFQIQPYADIYPSETQSADDQWQVRIEWQKRQETKDTLILQTINLTIFSPPSGFIVAPDSVTEVMVNGKPTALLSGGWNVNTQAWDTTIRSTQLMWTTDQLQYTLMFGPDVSLEQASAMAATIR